MDKNFYAQYYHHERKHWWFVVRSLILQDRIKEFKQTSPLKILNIGVATGRTSEILATFGAVDSVEYDVDCCNFLRENLKMEVINASITELPFDDEAYDLVCAFDVIEHVEDDSRAVAEMLRVCKRDGHVFVTVPAFMSLWSDHDIINHHFRRYKRAQLVQLFNNQPIGKIKRSFYFNSLLFPFIYVFRKLKPQQQSKEIKSDLETNSSSIANKFLYFLFNLERPFLKKFSFPVGVSIGLIFKK
jgi:2-polyprenyl-3-methyl-5-hydroxy-6-metoxy-1,4-benzoquinol methylase